MRSGEAHLMKLEMKEMRHVYCLGTSSIKLSKEIKLQYITASPRIAYIFVQKIHSAI